MGWDKGIDYSTAYALLSRSIQRKMGKRPRPRSLYYDAILLLQLRNGLRVSEAVRAFKQYIKRKAPELEVRLSKKKRPETRLVVVPAEVQAVADSNECVELLNVDDDVLVKRIKSYASSALGVNTHSLRYAFITHLLKQGVSPSIVARITKHSKLDFILRYTQERAAEDALRSL